MGLSSGLNKGSVVDWIGRIEDRLDAASSNGQLMDRRQRQEQAAMEALLDREILHRVKSHPEFQSAWERLQNDTHRTQNAAYDAIRTLLDGLD